MKRGARAEGHMCCGLCAFLVAFQALLPLLSGVDACSCVVEGIPRLLVGPVQLYAADASDGFAAAVAAIAVMATTAQVTAAAAASAAFTGYLVDCADVHPALETVCERSQATPSSINLTLQNNLQHMQQRARSSMCAMQWYTWTEHWCRVQRT